jgi:hypothetical protein
MYVAVKCCFYELILHPYLLESLFVIPIPQCVAALC